jgi:S1-C subfamily serine protease
MTPSAAPASVSPWQRVPARGLWLAATLALLIAVLLLAAWVWTRVPAVVERPVAQSPKELAPELQDRAAAIEAENRLLEAEIARRQQAAVICPPGQVMRAGVVPPSSGPSSSGGVPPSATVGPPLASSPIAGLPAASSPPAAVPAIPAVAAPPLVLPGPPPAGEKLEKLSSTVLADRLEKATVLVVANGSVGSGFFIGPQTVVTNRHVIQANQDRRVLVVSRSLGRIHPATILAASARAPTGNADFAVLRLDEGQAPAVLGLAASVPKLASIVASGYPGLALDHDPGFRRLMAGDVSASPDLNLTRGEVQSLQVNRFGVPVILHTAFAMEGNSGGPIVDACGRVVGVTTYGTSENAIRIAHALATSTLIGFLQDRGLTPHVDARECL